MTLPRTSSEKGSQVVLLRYLSAHGSVRELSIVWTLGSPAGPKPGTPLSLPAVTTVTSDRKTEAMHGGCWSDGGKSTTTGLTFYCLQLSTNRRETTARRREGAGSTPALASVAPKVFPPMDMMGRASWAHWSGHLDRDPKFIRGPTHTYQIKR
jgi:hypothetical protein